MRTLKILTALSAIVLTGLASQVEARIAFNRISFNTAQLNAAGGFSTVTAVELPGLSVSR